MSEALELLKTKVNVHGELHLDAEMTAALLRLLASAHEAIEGYNSLIQRLAKET